MGLNANAPKHEVLSGRASEIRAQANQQMDATDSERDSWSSEFERMFVAKELPYNDEGFRVLVQSCSLDVYREFESWCQQQGISHKKFSFCNGKIIITEIGITNAHARATGEFERQVLRYSSNNSPSVEEELQNFRDAERILGPIVRGPDASFGGTHAHCPHLIFETARGQSFAELCFYGRAFMAYSANATTYIGIKLYVVPGYTGAENFQMICVVYRKEFGITVANAVPENLISFGTAPIAHPARLTSIYARSNAPVGSMIGNTAAAGSVNCDQLGIDPPFTIHVSSASMFAPVAPPPHFAEDLLIDLYRVQRMAIQGHLSDL